MEETCVTSNLDVQDPLLMVRKMRNLSTVKSPVDQLKSLLLHPGLSIFKELVQIYTSVTKS